MRVECEKLMDDWEGKGKVGNIGRQVRMHERGREQSRADRQTDEESKEELCKGELRVKEREMREIPVCKEREKKKDRERERRIGKERRKSQHSTPANLVVLM